MDLEVLRCDRHVPLPSMLTSKVEYELSRRYPARTCEHALSPSVTRAPAAVMVCLGIARLVWETSRYTSPYGSLKGYRRLLCQR